MKQTNFIIFFSLVLIIYAIVNYYVFRKGYLALPETGSILLTYVFLFWFLAISYLGGRILENYTDSVIVYCLIWLGAFWLAAILYFFLLCLAIDFFMLFEKRTNLFGLFSNKIIDIPKLNLIAFIGSILLVGSILFFGYLNNLNPKITTYRLSLPKKNSMLSNLKVLVASDVHLGTTFYPSKIGKLIEQAERLQPDIILFAGDLLDEDPTFVLNNSMGDGLKKLSAKFGVWAIPGNHEYIGGLEKAKQFYKQHNINFLIDSVVIVPNSFNLVGRDDYSGYMWTGVKRKPLAHLLEEANPNLPTIVLDHQPRNLKEVATYTVDLQISGHTHHGQLLPLNLITSSIYENSYGYCKFGNTHFIVSSGFGVWGPPIRTGSPSEIVLIEVSFK